MEPRQSILWLIGFGVILVGIFYLVFGVGSWLRDSMYVVELVDGVVIAVLCFLAGFAILRRSRPRS